MYRNFKIVPNIIFGRGSFNQLGDILKARRVTPGAPMVFVLDDVHLGRELERRLPLEKGDLLLPVSLVDDKYDVQSRLRQLREEDGGAL